MATTVQNQHIPTPAAAWPPAKFKPSYYPQRQVGPHYTPYNHFQPTPYSHGLQPTHPVPANAMMVASPPYYPPGNRKFYAGPPINYPTYYPPPDWTYHPHPNIEDHHRSREPFRAPNPRKRSSSLPAHTHQPSRRDLTSARAPEHGVAAPPPTKKQIQELVTQTVREIKQQERRGREKKRKKALERSDALQVTNTIIQDTTPETENDLLLRRIVSQILHRMEDSQRQQQQQLGQYLPLGVGGVTSFSQVPLITYPPHMQLAAQDNMVVARAPSGMDQTQYLASRNPHIGQNDRTDSDVRTLIHLASALIASEQGSNGHPGDASLQEQVNALRTEMQIIKHSANHRHRVTLANTNHRQLEPTYSSDETMSETENTRPRRGGILRNTASNREHRQPPPAVPRPPTANPRNVGTQGTHLMTGAAGPRQTQRSVPPRAHFEEVSDEEGPQHYGQRSLHPTASNMNTTARRT